MDVEKNAEASSVCRRVAVKKRGPAVQKANVRASR
jgi:hypothetical protein